MGMNLVRGASGGVLGIASGALEKQTLKLGQTNVSYATVVEALGFVAGVGLQLASPYTIPDVADGIADVGVALLLRRGTIYAMDKMRVGTPAAAHVATRVYGNVAAARGDISGRFPGQNQTALV